MDQDYFQVSPTKFQYLLIKYRILQSIYKNNNSGPLIGSYHGTIILLSKITAICKRIRINNLNRRGFRINRIVSNQRDVSVPAVVATSSCLYSYGRKKLLKKENK